MNISFYLGSPSTNYENTIVIGKVKSPSMLDVLINITKESHCLFKKERHAPTSDETTETYSITMYLPVLDHEAKPYGSFEYLFDHSTYNIWKNSVLDKFPRLAVQFYVAEREAKTQQELERRYKELAILKGRKRASNRSDTKFIEDRIDELKQQLHPPYFRRHY